jgi:hypothetical protein
MTAKAASTNHFMATLLSLISAQLTAATQAGPGPKVPPAHRPPHCNDGAGRRGPTRADAGRRGPAAEALRPVPPGLSLRIRTSASARMNPAAAAVKRYWGMRTGISGKGWCHAVTGRRSD